jgi:hypothetical protein
MNECRKLGSWQGGMNDRDWVLLRELLKKAFVLQAPKGPASGVTPLLGDAATFEVLENRPEQGKASSK